VSIWILGKWKGTKVRADNESEYES
jgi:hypothetical protein